MLHYEIYQEIVFASIGFVNYNIVLRKGLTMTKILDGTLVTILESNNLVLYENETANLMKTFINKMYNDSLNEEAIKIYGYYHNDKFYFVYIRLGETYLPEKETLTLEKVFKNRSPRIYSGPLLNRKLSEYEGMISSLTNQPINGYMVLMNDGSGYLSVSWRKQNV